MVNLFFKYHVVIRRKKYPQGISASRLARNTIPTATPMLSGSNFSMGLSVTLSDKTGSQKSKMAAGNNVLSRIISNITGADLGFEEGGFVQGKVEQHREGRKPAAGGNFFDLHATLAFKLCFSLTAICKW